MIVEWLADRPIDTGAWEETRPNKQARRLIDWAAEQDPRGCFVSRSSIGFPRDTSIEEIGGLYVGVRNEDAHGDRKAAKKLKKEQKRESKMKKKR